MSAYSLTVKDYGNEATLRPVGNKPKQSEFQTSHRPPPQPIHSSYTNPFISKGVTNPLIIDTNIKFSLSPPNFFFPNLTLITQHITLSPPTHTTVTSDNIATIANGFPYSPCLPHCPCLQNNPRYHYKNEHPSGNRPTKPDKSQFPPDFNTTKFPTMLIYVRTNESTATWFPRKAKQRFDIAFNPAPVQNDMHQNQNDKNNRQNEMHIAPIVPPHRPQLSYMLVSLLAGPKPPAASKAPAAPPAARRQRKFDNKAGNSQTDKVQKGHKINNKVQHRAFHNIHSKKPSVTILLLQILTVHIKGIFQQ